MQRPDKVTRYAEARINGEFDTAAVFAGEAVDLVSDITSARDLIHRIVQEAGTLLDGATNRYR